MKFFEKVEVPENYILIDSPRKLAYLVDALHSASIFAFDIETTHPTVHSKERVREYLRENPAKIAGIAFAWNTPVYQEVWKPGLAAYVPLLNRDESPYWRIRQGVVISAMKEVLENPVPKVAHNGKFDVGTLATKLKILTQNLKFDTMLAHAILDEDKLTCTHALKNDYDRQGNLTKLGCANTYLNIEGSIFKEDLALALTHFDPDWRRFSKVPMDILYPYACADADMTLALVYPFIQMLEQENLVWVYQNIVMPLQHAVMLLELHGAPLNIRKARQVEAEQTKLWKDYQKVIYELAGEEFPVASTEKLGDILFGNLGLGEGKRSKHGKWIVDSDTLKKIEHPIVEPILQYRRAQKIQSTYATAALNLVDEVTGDIGWVHPTYWLDSATGRLKCQDPNLTNLPRPGNGGKTVKSMWECHEDYRILFKDFSQIELRVIAHESGEPVWVEGFNQGHDMHAAMAHRVWNLDCSIEEVKTLHKDKRSQAKAINFGIAFGESEYSLAERLGITYEEAYNLIHKEYFGTAPVLKTWIDETHRFVENYGWVSNMFGRRRHLPDAQIKVPDTERWPAKEIRPKCYRQCIAPYMIEVDPQDFKHISATRIKQLIKVSKHKRYFKCCNCRELKSCFVNTECKYLESKKARALRQSVNSIIQGGAADMSSLSLIWITEEFRKHGLSARPILYIHDEIGCYTHVQEIEAAERIMEDCMTRRIKELTQFRVPVVTDTEIVRCWGDKK